MTCQVGGCPNAGSVSWDADAGAIEVCEDHGAEMESGSEWILDPLTGDVLLGEAAPASIVALSATRVTGGRPGLLLRMTTTHLGEAEDLVLVLPPEEMAVLELLLDRYNE